MNCPLDDHELTLYETEGHIGYVCATCDGKWLPLRYIESIKYWRTWFSEIEFAKKLDEATQRQTNLECPARCDVKLSAALFHAIEVDWCERCRGVWFDKGELRKAWEMNMPKDQNSAWAQGDILSPIVEAVLGGLIP